MSQTADRLRVEPAGAVVGELVPPGDKSVSHRSVLLGGLAEGTVEVTGFGANEDTLASVGAMQSMGVRIEPQDEGLTRLLVHGVGLRGLTDPADPIDVKNAGTLLRLLPGILVGQQGGFVLDGDASIRRRPVDRIAIPLRQMGGMLVDRDGKPPLEIAADGDLHSIEYQPPVASAQIKSAVLLAGLYARPGPTVVIEPVPTRDHTERLLKAAGVRVERRASRISVWPAERLNLDRIEVPGDFSSAAPFLVAATLLHESHLFVRQVSINPARTGLLTVLERMGARVSGFNRRSTAGGEPIADIEARSSELVACEVEPELVPSLIDELPLVALLASMARGRTLVRGAQELKVKESNRLETVAELVRAVGGRIRVTDDGWEIRGVPQRLRGGRVQAAGDHRIAMLGAIAGLVSREGVQVEGSSSIAVSFPGFAAALEGLAQR
jgi:3-phosphoshikimate 1-carboxyvinyltransferase